MAVAYNIVDMIVKIGFGIVAWMGAKKATGSCCIKSDYEIDICELGFQWLAIEACSKQMRR